MSQMFSMPPRSLVKAIVFPSGEKRACESYAGPCVSARAAPPAAGTAYRSPSRSNRIVDPSGDASTETQVPAEVSNASLRASGRGALMSAATSFFAGVGLGAEAFVGVGVGVGVVVGDGVAADSRESGQRSASAKKVERTRTSLSGGDPIGPRAPFQNN